MDRKTNRSNFSCANRDSGIACFAAPAWSRRLMVAMVAAPLFVVGAFGQKADHNGSTDEVQVAPKTPQAGYVFVPESSQDRGPGFMHTTYVLRSSDGLKPTVVSDPRQAASEAETFNPDSTVEIAETPDSMGCLYVGSPSHTGCVPQYTGGPSAAGYGAIALVDAYDNPDAASDLATFDSEWGLAAPPSFTKLYANGNGDCSAPAPNAGWAGEESLDIEWAHVFAPKAAIILVEACSSSDTDLFYAEQVAFEYIGSHYPAGGQVSNSWAGGEFSGQISYDELFSDAHYSSSAGGSTTHILAFASAGDSGAAANYPSTNPWLISAGGTSVLRSATNDDFSSESCWSGSGGGESSQETYATTFSGGHMGPWANYQYPIFGQSNRRVPDMAFNADPNSGVWVYSQYGFGGWTPVGGTSVSSPSLAGIVNRIGNRLSSYFNNAVTGGYSYYETGEHNLIYAARSGAVTYGNFYDVTTGSNGYSAVANYDLCTGVGTPRGGAGK